MNRPRSISVAHAVRNRIERAGPNRLWTLADFADLERPAAAAALSRLGRAGVIQRVHRGIYYRPKPTAFGKSQPAPADLVGAIFRRMGAQALPTGLGAFNRLGLTPQVSGTLSVASERNSRTVFVHGPLRVFRRPLNQQRGIRADERTTLDALRDIRHVPGTEPSRVLARLRDRMATGTLDFNRLARFAAAEPPRVRALLGALGTDLKHRYHVPVRSAELEKLRKSLNDLTVFRMPGIDNVLPHAADWGIR